MPRRRLPGLRLVLVALPGVFPACVSPTPMRQPPWLTAVLDAPPIGQDPQPEQPKPKPAPAAAPAASPATPQPAQGDGRFSYEFYSGVEFSQRRGSFSQADPYIEFAADTAWRPYPTDRKAQDGYFGLDLANVHTWIDLSLQSAPVEARDNSDPTNVDEFIDSRKTFQGMVGLDWRCITLAGSDPATLGDVAPYRLYLGPTARIGLQTLDSDDNPANVTFETDDRTVMHWGVGLELGDHAPEQPERNVFNPPVRRRIAVYYGEYETFDHPKWTIEGMLTTSTDTGFFVGFTAVVGDGPDDITYWAGVTFGPDRLFAAVKALFVQEPGQ